MGGGDKEIHRQEPPQIPKGYVAVMVGDGGAGEEQRHRFVIPVMYLNHPLFLRLLKEAEEEYGFDHGDGPVNIPCPVDEFRRVQRLIDKETARHHHHNGGNHSWCFKIKA